MVVITCVGVEQIYLILGRCILSSVERLTKYAVTLNKQTAEVDFFREEVLCEILKYVSMMKEITRIA